MVSDMKTSTNKGCKIATLFFFIFFLQILPYWGGFLVLVFLTPFNGLLPPTSQSPMCNFFRFSKSLGKSNGKKWYQIWKHFLIQGVQLLQRKKVFYRIFFICSLRLTSFCPHFPKSNVQTFRFSESLGKSNWRFESFCS